MNLIVDIGNTDIKWAIFDKENLLETFRTSIIELVVPSKINAFKVSQIILCASGSISEQLLIMLKSVSDKVIIMTSDTDLPINVNHSTPQTLGLDRKAVCVGAYEKFPGRDCLIIDAGSAITFDLLLAKEGMSGGNISPGLNMRFRSLHNFTASLPLLKPKSTDSLLGFSTEDSIVNGVQNGVIAEVEWYINYYKSIYPTLLVIITGGDAQFFVKNLKSSIFAQPNLLLIGLNRILKYYAEKK